MKRDLNVGQSVDVVGSASRKFTGTDTTTAAASSPAVTAGPVPATPSDADGGDGGDDVLGEEGDVLEYPVVSPTRFRDHQMEDVSGAVYVSETWQGSDMLSIAHEALIAA